MASQDEPSLENAKRWRIAPPHHADRPDLHALEITKTTDGIVLSGRVDSTSPTDVLRRVEELLSELGEQVPGHSGSDHMNEPRADSPPADSDANSTDTPYENEDVLSWDNLIPVAPPRPGGRIRVRLRKVQRDHPPPAEDPWAN